MKPFTLPFLLFTVIIISTTKISYAQNNTDPIEEYLKENGMLSTLILDSTSRFKEDSTLKNTFTGRTDFYNNTISLYDLRERRRGMNLFNSLARIEEEEKEENEESDYGFIFFVVTIIFSVLYLFLIEFPGGKVIAYFINEIDNRIVILKDKTIRLFKWITRKWKLVVSSRKCPFCKTKIHWQASVCKHCLRNL